MDSITSITELTKQLNESLAGKDKDNPGLIGSVSMLLKTIEGFNKIKTDNIKSTQKNLKAIAGFTEDFGKMLNSIVDGLTKSLKDINVGDAHKMLIDVLMSKEISQNPEGAIESVSKDGSTLKYMTVKQPGLIDVILGIAGIGESLNKMEIPDPTSFLIKFAITLRLFKYSYNAIARISETMDKNQIEAMSNVTTALKDIMVELPMSLELMTEMFAKIGNGGKQKAARAGMRMLFGDKWENISAKDYQPNSNKHPQGSIIMGFMMLSNVMAEMPDDSVFTKFKKKVTAASMAIGTLMLMFIGVAVLAIPAFVGITLLFGVTAFGKKAKGGIAAGLLGMVISGFAFIKDHEKITEEAADSIISISLCIGLLSLSVLALALAGSIIQTSLPQILAVAGFIVLVVGMFMLVGLATKWIERGSKELFYIAATVGILALITIVLAMTGQFIMANWEHLKLVTVYMLALVGMFMLIGLSTKWIQQGGKELLFIAATVGILALIPIVMVLTGMVIKDKQEELNAVYGWMWKLIWIYTMLSINALILRNGGKEMLYLSLTTLIMAATPVIMAAAGAYIMDKQDEIDAVFSWMNRLKWLYIHLAISGRIIGNGGKSLILIAISSVIMVGVIYLLYLMADKVKGKQGMMWELFGLMTAIISTFGGIAALLAVAGKWLVPGMVYLGILIAFSYLMVGLINKIIKTVLRIEDLGSILGVNDNEGLVREMATRLSLPLQAFIMKIDTPDGKKSVFDMITGMGKVGGKVKRNIRRIKKIVGYIGEMAEVLQDIANMKIATEYTDDGKPRNFRQMTAKDFAMAAMNASGILGFFVALFNDSNTDNSINVLGTSIPIKPINESMLEGLSRSTKRKISRLSNISSSIGNMAETLQHIATLNIPVEWSDEGKPKNFRPMTSNDFADAAINASGILHFFVALFDESKQQHELHILGKTIHISPIKQSFLDNLSISTAYKMKILNSIIKGVGDMVDIIQKAATLAVPTAFDSEGKPIKWAKLEGPDFDTATNNVINIMTTLVEAISSDKLATQLDNMSRKAAKNFERIMGSISGVTSLVEATAMIMNGEYVIDWTTDENGNKTPRNTVNFKELNDEKKREDVQKTLEGILTVVIGGLSIFNNSPWKSKLSDANKQIENVQTVCSAGTSIIQEMMDMYTNAGIKDINVDEYSNKMGAPINIMKDIISHLTATTSNANSTNLTNVKQNIDAVRSLMVQINSTNLDKLKYASSMMQHIATLSKSIRGNFKELAKVINEDLISAIQELNDLLDEINESGININQTAQTTTFNDLVPNKNGERNAASQTGPNANVNNKLVDKIAGKFDDLIDAMASYVKAVNMATGSNIKIPTTGSSF